MKGLATLIKLKKRALDELRRQMVALENQKQQFIELSEHLEKELKREILLLKTAPEMSVYFGNFSKRMKQRQETVTQEIKKLDKRIQKLSEEISEAFSELKKFEIAKENAEKRAAKEWQRKEMIRLDEVAIQQDRQKKNQN